MDDRRHTMVLIHLSDINLLKRKRHCRFR